MAHHKKQPAFSLGAERERQFLQLALQFANATSDRDLLDSEHFLGDALFPQMALPDAEIVGMGSLRDDRYRRHPELKAPKLKHLRQCHDRLRQGIAVIHRNLKAARRDLEQSVNADLSRIHRMPYLKDGVLEESIFLMTGGVPHDDMSNPRAVAAAGEPFAAGFAYVLALLLDSKRPFGPALRQCALPTCNNYFLSLSRGGGPRPKFCSPEDGKAADNIRAATRMAELRAGEKARRHK